jgi:hypothetical protein
MLDLRNSNPQIPLHAKVPIIIVMELANAIFPKESESRSLLNINWSANVASAAPNEEKRRRIAFKVVSAPGRFSPVW